MSFASRADLLARSSALRLAQLAVPTDVEMVPDEALRLAITDGPWRSYPAAVQEGITLALQAIDAALQDADALIQSYGIAATVHSTLLARLASTIALYYLQGAERMTDDVRRAYEGAVSTLKAHARGEVSLVPATLAEPASSDDAVTIISAPRRYGAAAADDGS